jgi:integrase
MGNLHKRGGVYYSDYIDRAGKRQQKSLRTRDPQVARARLRELELSTTDSATHPTQALADALDYFTQVTCASKSAGTIESYEQKARHLGRLLGDRMLDHLTREVIERYVADRLKEGAHPHSLHKELVVLRGSLEAGRKRNLFHGSMEIVPEIDASYEPRRTYLTPEQFQTLADNILRPLGKNPSEVRRARWEARRVKRTLYVLLITLASPRSGEVESLRWEHVDFARNMILIPRGKTVSRVLKIHPVLRLWLDTYSQASGPIVEPWGNIRRDLPALCKRLGLPRCTPNDLRRTFASWLVQQGESLYVVSRLLGHKSTRMVELVYGQLDEATLARAIDRMPGSHAGYTEALPNRGTGGEFGTSPNATTITNTVENIANSGSNEVPRVGIEPTTRGFSGPLPNDYKPAQRRTKLRLIG